MIDGHWTAATLTVSAASAPSAVSKHIIMEIHLFILLRQNDCHDARGMAQSEAAR
jgi:hypothetical protein